MKKSTSDLEKKSSFFKSSNEILQEIEQASWEGQKKIFNTQNCREVRVELLPDLKVAAGMFRPDTQYPQHFYAHPDTIASVRRDLFVTDVDLDEFAQAYTCPSCHQVLDLQFWIRCPYCTSAIDTSAIKLGHRPN